MKQIYQWLSEFLDDGVLDKFLVFHASPLWEVPLEIHYRGREQLPLTKTKNLRKRFLKVELPRKFACFPVGFRSHLWLQNAPKCFGPPHDFAVIVVFLAP